MLENVSVPTLVLGSIVNSASTFVSSSSSNTTPFSSHWISTTLVTSDKGKKLNVALPFLIDTNSAGARVPKKM